VLVTIELTDDLARWLREVLANVPLQGPLAAVREHVARADAVLKQLEAKPAEPPKE
jgi:hypothetical protein